MQRGAGVCAKSQPLRVLIVDDHAIVRQGLALLINKQEKLFVCAEAEDVESAQQLIDTHHPNLVILDISLKKASGLTLLEQIKAQHEDLPVLVVTMHTESFYVTRALQAGANGYFMKQERAENLLLAIQTVLQGEIYLDKSLQNQMLNNFFGRKPNGNSPALEGLTSREFEILQLLGQGYETRQIALQLHISTKTVEVHRAHIKEKLGLKNTAELLQYAFKLVASKSD
jgi:DNA-binding NarL/FixJ family response regulator